MNEPQEKEKQFCSKPQIVAQLSRQGKKTVHEEGDGNCLPRALSRQILGDPELHEKVRLQICLYQLNFASEFGEFLRGDKNGHCPALRTVRHVAKMQNCGVYAGELEIQAVYRLYNLDIWVYSTRSEDAGKHTHLEPFYRFEQHSQHSQGKPVLLLRTNDNHYDSVLDVNDKENCIPASSFSDLEVPELRKRIHEMSRSLAATAISFRTGAPCLYKLTVSGL